MKSKTNGQVSFEEVELSLENVDKNDVVDESKNQTKYSAPYSNKDSQDVVIETSQVIFSSRSIPSQSQENVMYAAALIVFGVLIVVSLYAGLVFI